MMKKKTKSVSSCEIFLLRSRLSWMYREPLSPGLSSVLRGSFWRRGELACNCVTLKNSVVIRVPRDKATLDGESVAALFLPKSK